MSLQSRLRKVAPWWDRYDSIFALILTGAIIVGYVSFVLSRPETGISKLSTAWIEFLEHSGLLALLTAWTAIIALYRLRHRPDKIRPAVREDFDEGGAETDFGLRNFGPGPALYVQALVTVGMDDYTEDVAQLKVHEPPIHLREGEFVSLAHEADSDWVDNMAEKHDIAGSEEDEVDDQQTATVNLHFSYVSQSGAREPTHMSTAGDNEDVFKFGSGNGTEDDETGDKRRSSKPRNIDLYQVVSECRE